MTARAIMVQGTGSGVGKSIMVAALCRILHREGYKVSPFKAQNMALNSFATLDGKEMGRAQVVQAEAAGVLPRVEMNPILLKPNSDTGSQVVVMGKAIGDMTAQEYFHRRGDFLEIISRAYRVLSEDFDVIVIEGAGSPAEINLKDKDLVNMKMAELAQAPVILVTDVDRGGSFAWVIGTMELLTRAERARVCGFIFNKFRGDPSLIRPGLDMLESRTGLPVLGLVPFLPSLHIDEEDSACLNEGSKVQGFKSSNRADLDIAVVKLPRISNFSDFNALEREAGVRVRYVETAESLGSPDLAILPGTKSTMSDLLHVRERGFEERLSSLVQMGTPVVGICGGFQMLGRDIRDPHHVESHHDFVEGLGLLDTTTTFLPTKATYQVRAEMLDSSLPFFVKGHLGGYEIHMGITEGNSSPFLKVTERAGRKVEAMDGAVGNNGQILGTYLHGLFDNDSFRTGFLGYLRKKSGRTTPGGLADTDKNLPLDFQKVREEDYNKLAEAVKGSLRMDLVYKALGLH
ncbi:MAG: cobyric acid synthase [Candidatus Brocadiaceae bacterium]|nr:cobyric acid synthase [Candidatus Brocadiaceae bacterium]